VKLYQGIECDTCVEERMGLVIAGDGGMRGAVKNVSCEPGDKLRGIQRRQPIRCAETSRTWEYGYDRKPTKDLWTKPSYFIVGEFSWVPRSFRTFPSPRFSGAIGSFLNAVGTASE
jgi:hypothetical protein